MILFYTHLSFLSSKLVVLKIFCLLNIWSIYFQQFKIFDCNLTNALSQINQMNVLVCGPVLNYGCPQMRYHASHLYSVF